RLSARASPRCSSRTIRITARRTGGSRFCCWAGPDMFAFLKRRAFWTILGLLLAAALILLFGPLLAFGTARPLESYLGRGIAIAGLFAWYGLWTLLKRARANRAGNQLATAVVKQSEKERP